MSWQATLSIIKKSIRAEGWRILYKDLEKIRTPDGIRAVTESIDFVGRIIYLPKATQGTEETLQQLADVWLSIQGVIAFENRMKSTINERTDEPKEITAITLPLSLLDKNTKVCYDDG